MFLNQMNSMETLLVALKSITLKEFNDTNWVKDWMNNSNLLLASVEEERVLGKTFIIQQSGNQNIAFKPFFITKEEDVKMFELLVLAFLHRSAKNSKVIFLAFSYDWSNLKSLNFNEEGWNWEVEIDENFQRMAEANNGFSALNPFTGQGSLPNHGKEFFWRLFSFQKTALVANVEQTVKSKTKNEDLDEEALRRYVSSRKRNRECLLEIFNNEQFWKKSEGVVVRDLVEEFLRIKVQELEEMLPGEEYSKERAHIIKVFQGITRSDKREKNQRTLVGAGANYAQIILHTVNAKSRTHFGNIPEITMQLIKSPKNCHLFIYENETDSEGFLLRKISRLFDPKVLEDANPNQLKESILSRFGKHHYWFGRGANPEVKRIDSLT